MIKGVLTNDKGGKLLFMGIDDRNVERLTAGDPMLLRGKEVGLGIDVLIVHKPTLREVLAYLKKTLGIELPDVPNVGPAAGVQIKAVKGDGLPAAADVETFRECIGKLFPEELSRWDRGELSRGEMVGLFTAASEKLKNRRGVFVIQGGANAAGSADGRDGQGEDQAADGEDRGGDDRKG